MYGHTYSDKMNAFRSKDLRDYTGVIYVCPSFSTYAFRNPSYRIFNFDSETYALQDIKQYRLYIQEADAFHSADWRLAYSFKSYYNTSLEFQQVGKLVERILVDTATYNKYASMLQCEGSETSTFITSKQKIKYLKCALNASVTEEMHRCNGNNNIENSGEFTHAMQYPYIMQTEWYIT